MDGDHPENSYSQTAESASCTAETNSSTRTRDRVPLTTKALQRPCLGAVGPLPFNPRKTKHQGWKFERWTPPPLKPPPSLLRRYVYSAASIEGARSILPPRKIRPQVHHRPWLKRGIAPKSSLHAQAANQAYARGREAFNNLISTLRDKTEEAAAEDVTGQTGGETAGDDTL